MFTNSGVVHFGIPVSDLERSIDFYSKVVGCRLIRADSRYAFLDANGMCVLHCLQNEPINRPDALQWLHHAFILPADLFATVEDHLAQHGVSIIESENREGGTINGPRHYFLDPDGTRLEFINLTSYVTSKKDT